MNESDNTNQSDGRFTVVLLLLFGLLLFDFLKGHNFSFSERNKEDSGSCQQLRYIQPNSLVVENCLETGKGDGMEAVSARFSPFVFAAMPINSADKTMLMTVDGIGPALAEDIIAYRRQFGRITSSTDLLNLPGIGPKRAAKFAEAFTFTEKP